MVNIAPDSADVSKFDSDMATMRKRLGDNSIPTTPQMPVGVGFVTGSSSIGNFGETALPLIRKHTPAAVWLFAPDEEVNPHPTIISSLKALQPKPQVFVQVGNVKAAKEAVGYGADVLVCQGIDAGGHQFRQGMGVVSLVAGVKHMLREEGFDVGIVAAGGIANGDGVAAAMAMGIDGVVMGTRVGLPPFVRCELDFTHRNSSPSRKSLLILSSGKRQSSPQKTGPIHSSAYFRPFQRIVFDADPKLGPLFTINLSRVHSGDLFMTGGLL